MKGLFGALHLLITRQLQYINETTMQIKDYTIELRDVHLYAYHGVMEQERETGAWFTIDILLRIGDFCSLDNDNINGTVSYADVYDIIRTEMAKPSQLLENVCYRICNRIHRTFSQVTGITITLSKDTPPMGGDRLRAAVTINSGK